MKSIKSKLPLNIRRYLRSKLHFFYPRMKSDVWCLDRITLRDNSIAIRGWALPLKNNPSLYSFSINNKIFDEIDYPTIREDIGSLFWYRPGAEKSGFSCFSRIEPDSLFQNGFATFSFISRETRMPLREDHNYYCFDVIRDQELPIPEKKSRVRVQGTDSDITFRLEGFTNFMKLKRILKKNTGKDFADFSSILDWGCGCGRTTRYLNTVQNAAVTGADIDGDNIVWCQKNLDFGKFIQIPLHPPTSIPDFSFNLIFGISVFTHLRKNVQFEWLKELHRISRPDAILMMSVHGQESARRTVLAPEYFIPLQVKGFLDVGTNTDLDDYISGDNYYRDVYHLHSYIKNKWSEFFEIIDIIPGTIGNLQDLVVMRKKNKS